MEILSSISFVLFIYAIGVASPGPATLSIMLTSASRGRRAGIKLASGILLGSVIWGVCAAIGLSAIMTQFSWSLTAVKIAGALYLFWLAVKSFRSALSPVQFVETELAEQDQYFRRGLLLHMTNPKAVLVWTAIITLGLQSNSAPIQTFYVLVGCSVVGIIVFGGYAVLFSTPKIQSLYIAARRPIDGFVAVFFGLAGFKLLTTKLA